jgi:uncharacterized phage protein (TIGR02220 family)
MDTALIEKKANGFIKLSRNIKDWEHYKDSITKDVFIHILLSAGYTSFEFNGQTYPAGTTTITERRIAEDLGISRAKVRTALKKLQKSGELAQLKSGKYALYKVNNWDKFQKNAQNEKNHPKNSPKNSPINEAENTLNKGNLSENENNLAQEIAQEIALLKEDNKEINNNMSFSNENNAPSKNEKPKPKQDDSKEREIIDYFNEATGKRGKLTTQKTKAIRAILKMGYNVDDCKKVIDVKAKEWAKGKTWNDGTEPYKQYLNIETLFRKSKFEKYHEQALENETTSQPQQMNQRFNSNEEYEKYLNDFSDLEGLGF